MQKIKATKLGKLVQFKAQVLNLMRIVKFKL